MMDALARLVVLRAAWDHRGQLVRQARTEGATWDEIAEALNLSRMTVIRLSDPDNI